MNLLLFFPRHWAKLPSQVRQFLFRCVILIFIFELYNLGFESKYNWVNVPLTNSVSENTVKLLNVLNSSNKFGRKELVRLEVFEGEKRLTHANLIFFQDSNVLFIADTCNGFELQALFIGFILAFPSQWKRKFIFSIFGPFLIFYVNILRCALLVELRLNFPFHFDFAHHYLFKIIIYSFIFLLWYLFANNPNTSLSVEKK